MKAPMKDDPFVGYSLDMTAAQVCEAFRKRYGVDPAALIHPVGDWQHFEMGEHSIALDVIVTNHPEAFGMWYAGPCPKETDD